jgi:hypothetical protein
MINDIEDDYTRSAPTNIPYRDRSVTFIQWRPDQTIASSKYINDKRRWCTEGLPLFAAWTGKWSTDIFTVDKEKAKAALS